METGKPVIRLLHKDPFNELKGSYIEKTEKGRKLLEKFRSKMMTKPQRMVKFWSNELELGAAVDHSLRHLIKTRPALGWVRSDDVNVEIELENYRLKEMIEQTTTSLDDLEIAAALNMHVPLFERILRKELGEDFDALFLEVIEGIIDFFAEESRSAAEIAQCFQALGIGEDASHFLIDAMVTERIAEFTSEYRDYYRLTQVAFDIVSQARLKSYLSI